MCEIAEAVQAELVQWMGGYEPMNERKLEHLRQKMCLGKTGYCDRAEAKHRARLLLRHGFEPSVQYRCPFCGLYHLSSHRHKGDREYFERLRTSVEAAIRCLPDEQCLRVTAPQVPTYAGITGIHAEGWRGF